MSEFGPTASNTSTNTAQPPFAPSAVSKTSTAQFQQAQESARASLLARAFNEANDSKVDVQDILDRYCNMAAKLESEYASLLKSQNASTGSTNNVDAPSQNGDIDQSTIGGSTKS